jgi:DNA-binding transcriptional MerR regulator
MSTKTQSRIYSLQPFTLDPDAVYTIEVAAHLAQMPRHVVLICCKHRLVSPHIDPVYGGYTFDAEAIRTLQRIQYLREERGVNLNGIQIILELLDEVERLRTRASYSW